MKKPLKKALRKLNDFGASKRTVFLQLLCVLIPIFLTEGIILGFLVQAEKRSDNRELQNIADSVKYTLSSYSDAAATFIQEMYVNYDVDQFIQGVYESPLDYYNEHLRMMKTSWLTVRLGDAGNRVTIYTDTEGLVNGGSFQSIDKVKDAKWYQDFQQQDQRIYATAGYVKQNWEYSRMISFVRKLDYYNKDRNAILKVDMDYSKLLRNMNNAKYGATVYVCYDDMILLSNDGKGGLHAPFEKLNPEIPLKAGEHRTMTVCERTCDIYVMPMKDTMGVLLEENAGKIALLLLLNVAILFIMLNLIQGEYRNKLKQRESDIAKQNAELLALHSQINPHFLFNALESIRMHSIIKHENETADMVEQLALMQRQYVYWGEDFISIQEELRFVEAYLQLQKYRFGDRLNYKITVEEECKALQVPRLTIVTFAENACVHGMEQKASASWIYIRIYKADHELILEIEDTGSGMSEEKRSELARNMNTVTLDMLKENKSVGTLNAALRLRRYTEEHVFFEVKGQEGEGTTVTIHLPEEQQNRTEAE